jgi:hypothetical protein
MQLINQNSVKPPEASLQGQVSTPISGQIAANRLIVNSLELSSQQGTSLKLVMLSASQVTLDFATLQETDSIEVRHGLTNFMFLGCLASHTPSGQTLDKFNANLDGTQITFRQLLNWDQMNALSNQDISLTAEAIAQIHYSDLARVNEELIQDSLILLSFASGTYISSIYEDVYISGRLAKTLLKSEKTTLSHFHDFCVDVKNLQGCDLQSFLESAHPVYRKLSHDLGLDVVIEYYLQMKLASLLELKYLIGVVGIECLLSYVPSYFSKIGKWRKGSSLVDKIMSRILRRPGRRSLGNKIMALLNHFSITYNASDLQFIRIRNKLVHTGHFPPGLQYHTDPYLQLVNFLDRILLTILGYKGGYYLNRLKGYQREALT